MTQQDKNWTRGEMFSAVGLLFSGTGLTIALISASANKDIRCSIAHIDCDKPQPVTVVQPSNDLKVPQYEKSTLVQSKVNKQTTSIKPVSKDISATSVIYSYYQEINSRSYNAAWNRLPTSTQQNKNIDHRIY